MMIVISIGKVGKVTFDMRVVISIGMANLA